MADSVRIGTVLEQEFDQLWIVLERGPVQSRHALVRGCVYIDMIFEQNPGNVDGVVVYRIMQKRVTGFWVDGRKFRSVLYK
jgi:hypothetical protein